jgi:hypothetical protein
MLPEIIDTWNHVYPPWTEATSEEILKNCEEAIKLMKSHKRVEFRYSEWIPRGDIIIMKDMVPSFRGINYKDTVHLIVAHDALEIEWLLLTRGQRGV